MADINGGFLAIPMDIVNLETIDATSKLIYGIIFAWTNQAKACYESNATIAKKCGCSQDTVKRHIADMIEAGLLRRTITPARAGQLASRILETVPLLGEGRGQNAGEWGAKCPGGRGQNAGEGRGQNKPVLDHINKQINRSINRDGVSTETPAAIAAPAPKEPVPSLPQSTPPETRAAQSDARGAAGAPPAKAARKPRAPAQRFTPPTQAEVAAYCAERGKGVDPERWYDYYTANGWRVGRNAMKDWRAAVRTWERNGYADASGATPARPRIAADGVLKEKLYREK